MRLIGDGLQFGMSGLLSLAQFRQSCAQFVDRNQALLIGAHQAVHGLADACQITLQDFSSSLCRIGCPCRRQASIEFALDQAGIFEQLDDLAPDDLVEQVLA